MRGDGILVLRDAKNFRKFYDLFGLTYVAIFEQEFEVEIQTCYSYDIVYQQLPCDYLQ